MMSNCLLSLLAFGSVSLKSSAVLFQPIQSASPSFSLDIPFYLPEGLAYDTNRDRVILGSLATGAIRAFPNSDDFDSRDESTSSLIYSGSINGTFTPVAGIKVYGDVLYAGIGSLPPLSGPFYGGLLILDLTNPSDAQLVDFSSLYNGLLMLPNDVAYSSYDNAIYVTDFYSYRIFKYDLTTQVR
jgi:hypothetical protein